MPLNGSVMLYSGSVEAGYKRCGLFDEVQPGWAAFASGSVSSVSCKEDQSASPGVHRTIQDVMEGL